MWIGLSREGGSGDAGRTGRVGRGSAFGDPMIGAAGLFEATGGTLVGPPAGGTGNLTGPDGVAPFGCRGLRGVLGGLTMIVGPPVREGSEPTEG